jgi:hypothetical protein
MRDHILSRQNTLNQGIHLPWNLRRISIGKSERDNALDNAGDSDTCCTCLGHLGLHNTDRITSTGQDKQIRRDIVHDIALNIANVNDPLIMDKF